MRATFSINLWFKVGDSQGDVFQYLLSQQGKPDGDEWGPSQVQAALLGLALSILLMICRLPAGLTPVFLKHSQGQAWRCKPSTWC